ncbi:hypothetical protein CU254_14185 [Amycolatopsis sp. AA4]|uniref:hypothetical protein n=1 Tax=Actinomycetes TaxID=1760 RepID=UPI0001B53A5A|nr:MULTISPECIES: hypothetical protein [Actinomycetes]ATY11482.1 hypothetical protein CU254_14185 [Amycolatopsis sp. AA4]EFL07110.1 predicted protein [Streptomyces sp. AA4]
MIRPVSHRFFLRCGVVATAAALACTACSGSGGSPVAPPPTSAAPSSPVKPFDAPPDAATVGDTVANELGMARAVHIKGTTTNGFTVDLQLNHDSAGGSIEVGGGPVSLVRVGDTTWIKITDGMTKITGVPAGTPSKMNGKWLSADSPLLHGRGASLKSLLDIDAFLGSAADDLGKPGYSAGEPVDLAGTPAVRYRNGSNTIYLERFGTTYSLVRYESPKQGAVDFDMGEPRPVAAPPAAEIYSGPGS